MTPVQSDKGYVRMMGILDGRRLLMTGVLTESSIATAVTRLALSEGADIVLSGAGRGLRLTERVAGRLGEEARRDVPVIAFDVTDDGAAAAVTTELRHRLGHVDGALHAIGFAPPSCLGEPMLDTGWDDVATAFEVSTYSLRTIAAAVSPLMATGGSIVGLTFDATVAWPAYNWMGVAKAGLESLNRYLARDLGDRGIRCNLVAAGPLRTMAARSIPGFAAFEDAWDGRAPLGWDVNDATAVARACVALLSNWFPATTGEIIHVDGGYHAVGA